jgi:hypothetical protein
MGSNEGYLGGSRPLSNAELVQLAIEGGDDGHALEDDFGLPLTVERHLDRAEWALSNGHDAGLEAADVSLPQTIGRYI